MTEGADFHWGTDAVDLNERSLPSLKARFLVDHVPDRGRLLEIGCGGGKLLRTLKQHRPRLELFGCDVRVPPTPPQGFAFRRIDQEGALPFDDGSLDIVVVFDVLEHVPDPARTLAEAARVLGHGGRLVAFVPIEGERFSAYTLFRAALGAQTYADTKEHVQAFTHAGLRALVERHFDVVVTRYAYHAIGHVMDATFFAAHKMTWLREMFWRDNVYYNGPKKAPGVASRVMNGVLRAANAAAWGESTLLARSQTLSAGVLFEARKKRARKQRRHQALRR
jgi:SAM-dependent methyltransferase